MKIVSWNIARRKACWRVLREMDVDVALFQEATKPPRGVSDWAEIEVNPGPWRIAGKKVNWRSAIVRLSDRVSAEWIEDHPLGTAKAGDFAVSRPGTLAAARITGPRLPALTVVSMYGAWENYSRYSNRTSVTMAAGSVHRAISDLSRLVGSRTRLIAAGDLNIYRRWSDKATPWKWPDGSSKHYGTIFDRMEAIGVPFVGPQAPFGRVPTNSARRAAGDVVTYYTPKQREAAKASQQLDFVFATNNLGSQLSVTALNEVDGWGPSDHCRILIDLDARQNAANAASSRSARAQADLSNWSCDQCSTTVDDLILGFGKKFPKSDPMRYLPRIVGGHKAHHTRQARRAAR